MISITDLKPVDGNTAFELPGAASTVPHAQGRIRGFIASAPSAGAWDDRALKGFAYSSEFAPDILQLEHIFVSSEMRGLSLGTRLLAHLEKEAAKSGYETIILVCDAMGSEEKSPVGFFLHNGFSISVSTSSSTLLWKSI